MNKTVAIKIFAEQLARRTAYTPDFCERFVVEMFNNVADVLKEGDYVAIKGLGRFFIGLDNRVCFEPDAAFADEVNAPFACFEAEELADDITPEMLVADDSQDAEAPVEVPTPAQEEPLEEVAEESIEEEVKEEPIEETIEETAENALENISAAPTPEPQEVTVGEAAEETPEVTAEVETPAPDTVEEEIAENEPVASETEVPDENVEPVQADADQTISDYDMESDEEPLRELKPSRKNFWWGMLAGMIVGAAAVYIFMVLPLQQKSPSDETLVTAETEQPVSNSALSQQPTAAPDTVAVSQPVDSNLLAENATKANDSSKVEAQTETVTYDVITTTLAQLSRKHFTRYEFWVYIYLENQDVIKNPNLVEPNTRVKIPSREKYGIDPTNRESVERALKLAQTLAAPQ